MTFVGNWCGNLEIKTPGAVLHDHGDDVALAGGESCPLGTGVNFEDGLIFPWGTGHYERMDGKFHFGIWWNSENAKAFTVSV